MATKTSDTRPTAPAARRPAWITPLFAFLILLLGLVALTQIAGRASEKDFASFSSATAAFGSFLPILAAAVVGWLIPQGYGVRVRLPLADGPAPARSAHRNRARACPSR